MTEGFGNFLPDDLTDWNFSYVHPGDRLRVWGTDPREAPRAVWFKKTCFGTLVPEDVIGKPAEFTNADNGFMWRVNKDKMEVTAGGTWTKNEWDPRTLQLREYIQREFSAIFVDDRPF